MRTRFLSLLFLIGLFFGGEGVGFAQRVRPPLPPRTTTPQARAPVHVARPPADADRPLPGADRTTLAGKHYEMALGLEIGKNSSHLDLISIDGGKVHRFASKIGAKGYFDIYAEMVPDSAEKLKVNIHSAMRAADRLHFNMDGFDLGRFRKYLAEKPTADPNEVLVPDIVTNWELKTVLSEPRLLAKATFYGPGGVVIPAPELANELRRVAITARLKAARAAVGS